MPQPGDALGESVGHVRVEEVDLVQDDEQPLLRTAPQLPLQLLVWEGADLGAALKRGGTSRGSTRSTADSWQSEDIDSDSDALGSPRSLSTSHAAALKQEALAGPPGKCPPP